MGKVHTAEYRHLDDVEVVGLVEPDESKWAALREDFGFPISAEPGDLPNRVDVVSICTPDDVHLQSVRPWLAAGTRVLLEKPLATSVADGKHILDLRPSVDSLTIGHVLRFDGRVIRSRDLVAAGELGDIWHVEVWRNTTRAVAALPAQRTTVSWFLGIHDIDLVRYVTNLEVESVSAVGRACLSDNDDAVFANLRYKGGVIGSMQNTWTVPNGRPERHPSGLRVTGSKGAIELNLGQSELLRSSETAGSFLDSRSFPSQSREDLATMSAEIRAFVDAARTNGPTPVSGEDGLAAVEVVERIHESMDRGGEPLLVRQD